MLLNCLKTTFILNFIFISASFAQKKDQNTVSEIGLHGKVKFLHQTYYKVDVFNHEVSKGDRIDNTERYESQLQFDESGYKIEEIKYDASGKTKIILKYIYDDSHNCIEEDSYKPGGKLDFKKVFVYKYDDAGRITEKKWVTQDGKLNKETLKYDPAGNVSERIGFKVDGTQDFKYTFVYDTSRNIIESSEFDQKGIVNFKTVFKFNGDGKPIEETIYKRGEIFFITYKREFDTDGNEIKVDWCEKNGKVTKTYIRKYEFDKNKNWTKVTELRDVDKGRYISYSGQYIIERRIQYMD